MVGGTVQDFAALTNEMYECLVQKVQDQTRVAVALLQNLLTISLAVKFNKS